MAVDGSGSAYVTGQTDSSDFPTTATAFDTTANGGADGFVARMVVTGPTSPDVDAWVQAPAQVGGPSAGLALLPLQYGNSGATTAASTVLTATLDSRLVYAGDTSGISLVVIGDSIGWSLPDLAFRDTGGFSVQVSLPDAPPGAQFPVTLTITSAGPEAIPGDNVAHVQVIAVRRVFLPLIVRDH